MGKKLTPLESLISPDDIRRLHAPISEATGLPGAAYGSAFHEVERHTLFRSRWCVIGVGAEIPHAGDVMEVELAGWPLFAVRTQTGEIRCFYNICRHRANRLIEGKHNGMSRLSCSWHGWTYDLEGNLLSTPDLGGGGVHEAKNFCKTSLGLKRVPTSTWLDYILVNLDGTAPPLAEHLQPLNQFLSSYDFSGLCYSSSARFEYPGNWKVGIEGAIEDYHVPWGHGQMVRQLKKRHCEIDTADGCFAATRSTMLYHDEGPSRYGNNALPAIPNTNVSEHPQSLIVNLFPVGVIGLMADHMMLGSFSPLGWDRTLLSLNYYFVGDAATDPALAQIRSALLDDWNLIVDQDYDYVRNVHDMYQVRDTAGIETRFSPHWEGAVHHFQQMVADAICEDVPLPSG